MPLTLARLKRSSNSVNSPQAYTLVKDKSSLLFTWAYHGNHRYLAPFIGKCLSHHYPKYMKL